MLRIFRENLTAKHDMSTDIPNHLVKKVYPSYTIDMQMYGMSGEPLGHIGQSEMSKIPAWKRDALAKPTASVRKGIAWVSFHHCLTCLCLLIVM